MRTRLSCGARLACGIVGLQDGIDLGRMVRNRCVHVDVFPGRCGRLPLGRFGCRRQQCDEKPHNPSAECLRRE